jgi:uncharacterized membrane protein (UPF0136 family)
MFGPTKTYFIAFGLLTIAGGVIGYTKVRSAISLAAGAISGALLLFAAFLMPSQARAGLILGALASPLLIGYFLPAFFRTRPITPAGMRSVLSILGVIFALLAWMRE